MRNITVKLPSVEQISITPLSDIHFGDSNCDWSVVRQRINTIRSDPNSYCILNGDLIDNATRNSIGDIYNNTHNPNEQLNQISMLLQPIKDKILLAQNGNHEQRTWKTDSIDLTERLCRELGIVDKYVPETAVLSISIGKQQYKVYVTHGSGGGRKIGAKANRLLELSDIVDADVYIQGHTHVPMVTRKTRMETVKGGVVQKEMLFCNSASALTYGGYGEIQGFTPSSTMNPVIYLSGKTKLAWAVL